MKRLLAALAATAAVSLGAPSAFGFCRTTTCDVSDPSVECNIDARGCATAGTPLQWKEGCLSFTVQKDGSAKRGITYDVFHESVQSAFTQWVSAPCQGGKPSFSMYDLDTAYGPATCGQPEYNRKSANANIWMFRDNDWPYLGATSTLALTTVSFEIRTGRILDADVEVNSYSIAITTSDQNPSADLRSIATHEAGHFLGLAHSDDTTATMYMSYAAGNLSFRSLRPDDQAGICAVYPPGRSFETCASSTPVRGLSLLCGGADPVIPDPERADESGCAVAPGASSLGGRFGFVLAAGLAGAALALRRSRRARVM